MNEEHERTDQFQKVAAQAEQRFESKIGIDAFKEDWNLSQFWYDDATANLLADELLEGADANTQIVIVSAPSVYGAISKRNQNDLPTKHIYLLEFDDRFSILAGDKFVHYDFVRPLDLPKSLAGTFDRILVDPPFLSEDCQTKASLTARWLTKKDDPRIIVCTGERMGDLIKKVYPTTRETSFHPEHGKGLSNEFRCYASYESKNWRFVLR